jgi:hypothetical protein
VFFQLKIEVIEKSLNIMEERERHKLILSPIIKEMAFKKSLNNRSIRKSSNNLNNTPNIRNFKLNLSRKHLNNYQDKSNNTTACCVINKNRSNHIGLFKSTSLLLLFGLLINNANAGE